MCAFFELFFTFIYLLDLPVNKSATIIHVWSVLLGLVEYKPLDVTTSRV